MGKRLHLMKAEKNEGADPAKNGMAVRPVSHSST